MSFPIEEIAAANFTRVVRLTLKIEAVVRVVALFRIVTAAFAKTGRPGKIEGSFRAAVFTHGILIKLNNPTHTDLARISSNTLSNAWRVERGFRGCFSLFISSEFFEEFFRGLFEEVSFEESAPNTKGAHDLVEGDELNDLAFECHLLIPSQDREHDAENFPSYFRGEDE